MFTSASVWGGGGGGFLGGNPVIQASRKLLSFFFLKIYQPPVVYITPIFFVGGVPNDAQVLLHTQKENFLTHYSKHNITTKVVEKQPTLT